MNVLRSYLCGRWWAPAGDGMPLSDPATGEEVARISPAPISTAAALDYARREGGPALRELTFRQRAELLKELASCLRRHRAELCALSARGGATLADAEYDIDGGLAALRAYARVGARELPPDTIAAPGDSEPLVRDCTVARHRLASSRHGVAVQINSFSLPVWAPLEKLAKAMLAGMPSVVRPATPTAYVTARLVELIIASDSLPAGTLQLICGASDLADQVTRADVVSFSGASRTAQRLAAHPGIRRSGVGVDIETESLTCAILGTGGERADALAVFVEHLVASMTRKAGQLRTAPRRAFVPAASVDHVADAVAARLAEVRVGHPGDPDVDMGPLVDLEHLARVRRAVAALMSAGRAVFGAPDVAGAARGAFMSPVLLRVDDAEQAEPHRVEAFGPVCTLLPYRTPTDIAAALARGRGGLSGWLVADDPADVRNLVRSVAPWHDRIQVLDPAGACAAQAHDRESAGSDADRLREIMRLLQTTTVHASPGTLGEVTGRWVQGATRNTTGRHPLRRYLDELNVGDAIVVGPRKVTRADIAQFAELTGDTYYLHTNDTAARRNPLFGGIIAHGYLVVSFAAGLFVTPEPGPVLANLGLENLRFLAPVRPGDELIVTLTAKQITPRERAGCGEVRWDVDVSKQDGQPVARYDILTLTAKAPECGGVQAV